MRPAALEDCRSRDDLVPVSLEGLGGLVVHQVQGELVDTNSAELAEPFDVLFDGPEKQKRSTM